MARRVIPGACAMPMPIGVPITAAALLETTFVRNASNNISADNTIGGEALCVANKNSSVKYWGCAGYL